MAFGQVAASPRIHLGTRNSAVVDQVGGGGFLWRVAEVEIHKSVEEIKYNYEEQHKIQQDGVRKTFGSHSTAATNRRSRGVPSALPTARQSQIR